MNNELLFITPTPSHFLSLPLTFSVIINNKIINKLISLLDVLTCTHDHGFFSQPTPYPLKWYFPIILYSVPCSLFRSLMWTLCVVSSFIGSLCSVFGLPLFWVPSEYLQIFLGIPDTGILLDTSVIYHDSP